MSTRPDPARPARGFVKTRWSLVAAARQARTPESRKALAELCEGYWYPLYAYVRRKGYGVDEAQDLTQGFFVRLLEKNYLADADPERGKLRIFLLTALERFIADEWKRELAKKRRPEQDLLSWDMKAAENRYARGPADYETPEKILQRQWVQAVLDQATAALAAEYAGQGQQRVFELLKDSLDGELEVPYKQIGAELKASENLVRVVVHRMRARYRELVRQEISQTVSGPIELAEELAFFRRVLESSPGSG